MLAATDGKDVVEVYKTVKSFASQISNGISPVFIEYCTFCMKGNEERSGIDYVLKPIGKHN